ncbi:hypothetical protein GCM10010191_76690 [Actinomadura vinacea]|uniref:Tetracycline repressor TetR C-terminal domain-containing protein n=1 Tax=Actinomadura vinacea TaxID=115336 RepID=A0ABN3K460_9ACTN
MHAYRAAWYYTVGEILVRAAAARRRAEGERPTYRDRAFADLDPEVHPRLSALAGRWAPLTAADTYADGLRALLDGLLARHGGERAG